MLIPNITQRWPIWEGKPLLSRPFFTAKPVTTILFLGRSGVLCDV